jgi:hypothetical protein
MEELRLQAFSAYKAYLESNPGDWPVLDSLCGITITSGEETYTLQIIWQTGVVPTTGRDILLRIIATDMNEELLERAQRGRYPGSSLRYLPGQLQKPLSPAMMAIRSGRSSGKTSNPCNRTSAASCRKGPSTSYSAATSYSPISLKAFSRRPLAGS